MTRIKNSGVVNLGGTTNVANSAVGKNAAVTITGTIPDQLKGHREPQRRLEVGIVTVLAVETQAVRTVLGLGEASTHPRPFYTGTLALRDGEETRVVATRALGQGQRSVMMALKDLREHYDPEFLVLTGLGGGIHRDVDIGDVVIATRVVYYDLRKVTGEKILHRGEERESPPSAGHAVNSFFTDHGEAAELHEVTPAGEPTQFRVFSGPIGSGDAVIADAESDIRSYLSAYNDKILAVDMEAAGLGNYCHESASTTGTSIPWVVIRGISDHADMTKTDEQHQSAAMNAAYTLRRLIPYLSRTT